MFKDEYGRRKNTIPLLLIILFVIALLAAAFFYYNKNIIAQKIETIDTADYTANHIEVAEKKERETLGVSLSQHTEASLGDDTYLTPLGFTIVSYSSKWTGEKLVDIYDELLNNKHGNEMRYISKVVVHPGRSELGTNDSVVAGAHTTKTEDYTVFFDLPGFVPPSLKYNLSSTLSVIELYNMDSFDTVDEAARTIAHEYGHHYTMHYFMRNDEAVKKSDYYNLRNFATYEQPIFYDDPDVYFDNHQWSIYEIAAEDYVQLLGSPNAKKTKRYMDIYDVLMHSHDKVYYAKGDETTVNVFPQENIYIPLADEVNGLRDYYNSFINQSSDFEPLESVDFNLSIEKHHKSGYTYYDIKWDKPTTDKDALYTLVCYDMDGNIFMPVKTVFGDKNAIAKVGTVSKLSGTTLTTCTNSITDEDRYFKLYLIYPDGRMQSSELFYADF